MTHGNQGKRNAAHEVSPDAHLHVRCTDKDKRRWKRAAKIANVNLSRWVSDRLNKAIEK